MTYSINRVISFKTAEKRLKIESWRRPTTIGKPSIDLYMTFVFASFDIYIVIYSCTFLNTFFSLPTNLQKYSSRHLIMLFQVNKSLFKSLFSNPKILHYLSYEINCFNCKLSSYKIKLVIQNDGTSPHIYFYLFCLELYYTV